MYYGDVETEPYRVPTTGHFHIWSLVSAAGDSLLNLSRDNEQLDISCSGSFSQGPAQFEDTTVFPTASLSIKLQEANQGSIYLSIHQSTQDVSAKGFRQEEVTDDARLIGWPYNGFVMFESKSHPKNFLGCTKEGTAQLFYIHERRHPDPRTLFVLNNAVDS